jgi:hypothetical protein
VQYPHNLPFKMGLIIAAGHLPTHGAGAARPGRC